MSMRTFQSNSVGKNKSNFSLVCTVPIWGLEYSTWVINKRMSAFECYFVLVDDICIYTIYTDIYFNIKYGRVPVFLQNSYLHHIHYIYWWPLVFFTTASRSASISSSLDLDIDYDELDATHRGCHKFVPRHDDELFIEIGDPIYVQVEAEDLWCEGRWSVYT